MEEEQRSRRKLCGLHFVCTQWIWLEVTESEKSSTVWENVWSLWRWVWAAFPDTLLLKHYSQNPTSPGTVSLPCGEWLAFKWDARSLTLAGLKQKMQHTCSGWVRFHSVKKIGHFCCFIQSECSACNKKEKRGIRDWWSKFWGANSQRLPT